MDKLKKVYKLIGNQETNNSSLERKIKKFTKEKTLKIEQNDLILKNDEESSLKVIKVSSINIV